jgi:hypothetical protein
VGGRASGQAQATPVGAGEPGGCDDGVRLRVSSSSLPLQRLESQ